MALSAIFVLGFSTLAQAEEKVNFTGAGIAVGIDSTYNGVQYQAGSRSESTNGKSIVLGLDASYGFNLSENWVATAGMTYGMGSPSMGISPSANYPSGIKASLKNRYSFYVAPGYRISPKWLVYGKLSWQHANSVYTVPDVPALEASHAGFGYAIGIKTALTEHLEASFELQSVKYKQADMPGGATAKPKTTEAILSLGYRF